MNNSIFWLLLVCIGLFLLRKFLSRFKFPKISGLNVFTGPLGSGKTVVSLAISLVCYHSVLMSWRIRSFFLKMFKKPIPEKPLFYSNIPLALKNYCELTLDHILRRARFNYKSVVFIDEASLLADCYLSKDCKDISVDLMVFFKLFRHETRGGVCVVNSQQISDLHIALRKVTNSYFYLHDTVNSPFVPFFAWTHMREERYSEDGSTINNYDEDVETSLKTCIFKKKVYKLYDTYAYESLTRDLPLHNVFKSNDKYSDLSANKIISFRKAFADLYNLKNKNLEDKNV